MSREDTRASPFAALYESERKRADPAGAPKMQVQAKTGRLKLPATRSGVRRFHPGHRLAGSRINNIVKVKFVRNNRDSTRHIIQHVDYIEKRERDRDEAERKFYSRDGERLRDEVIHTLMVNRGEHAAMFKIILSPKQNELDHVEYTREIMRRFEEKSRIVTDWSFVQHQNTEHHHVHIVMPGRDVNGESFRLEKEDLNLLREIANEYQYELQDRDYQQEKQIEHEFGFSRDEANILIQSARDFRDMKDLGLVRPELDKLVQKELLTPSTFNAQQQKESRTNEFFRPQHQLSAPEDRTEKEAAMLKDLADQLERTLNQFRDDAKASDDRAESVLKGQEPEYKTDQDQRLRAAEMNDLAMNPMPTSDLTGYKTAGFSDFFMGQFHSEDHDTSSEADMLFQDQNRLSWDTSDPRADSGPSPPPATDTSGGKDRSRDDDDDDDDGRRGRR